MWENLATLRYTLKNSQSGEEVLKLMTPEQEADAKNFVTSDGIELETVERMTLTEWFANNYKTFGATLEFITNRSQEGSQFCRGFGGIGGILQWRVDFQEMDFDELDEHVVF